MQQSARSVYQYIESWLGEELGETTAQAASNWPPEHLVEFAKQWPDTSGPDLDAEIAPVTDGSLRPITALSGPSLMRHETVLQLLLYAPALLIPEDDLLQDWYVEDILDEDARSFLRRKITWLSKIRPLVEEGAIVFSRRQPNDGWSALIDGLDATTENRFRLLDSMTRADWEREGWFWPPASAEEFMGFNRAVSAVMGTSLELATRGAGQALALDRVEQISFRHVLSGKRVTDERVTTLQRLAQFKVPTFNQNLDLLLSLRRSDDWERWRTTLSEGVALVSDIRDIEGGARQATAILTDHLKTSLFNLNNATARSPALTAARSGAKGFTLSGLTAVAGFASTGDPAGLLLGAVPVVGDLAWDYINALLRRRKSYALLDTVIAFANLT